MWMIGFGIRPRWVVLICLAVLVAVGVLGFVAGAEYVKQDLLGN
jgi:hypothetical protein